MLGLFFQTIASIKNFFPKIEHITNWGSTIVRVLENQAKALLE
jgi:hypothetical protein